MNFDNDPFTAILEYAALQAQFPGQPRIPQKTAWNQAHLVGGGNDFMDVWVGPPGTLTKSHLTNILSVGRDGSVVRQNIDRVFRVFESHGLIQAYGPDATANTTYRVITPLGLEIFRNDCLEEFLYGFSTVVEKWRGSVFKLVGENNEGIGTAFLIERDKLVTARHIVEDLGRFSVQSELGTSYDYTDVTNHPDPDIDLALVTLAEATQTRPFRLSLQCDLLEPVVVFGYPPIPRANDAYLVVNRGEISAMPVQYPDRQRILIVSALLRGGNSGGPVVNRRGGVVGVVSRQLFKQVSENEKTINESLGFAAATPASQIANNPGWKAASA